MSHACNSHRSSCHQHHCRLGHCSTTPLGGHVYLDKVSTDDPVQSSMTATRARKRKQHTSQTVECPPIFCVAGFVRVFRVHSLQRQKEKVGHVIVSQQLVDLNSSTGGLGDNSSDMILFLSYLDKNFLFLSHSNRRRLLTKSERGALGHMFRNPEEEQCS